MTHGCQAIFEWSKANQTPVRGCRQFGERQRARLETGERASGQVGHLICGRKFCIPTERLPPAWPPRASGVRRLICLLRRAVKSAGRVILSQHSVDAAPGDAQLPGDVRGLRSVGMHRLNGFRVHGHGWLGALIAERER
jgi:hypothetical protein